MAVTITRSVWIDDDGTGQTGTVINQALHTTLYNEIDTALAKVAQLAGGNVFTGNQQIAKLLVNTNNPNLAQAAIAAVGPAAAGLAVQNTDPANSITFVAFYNSAYGVAGSIAQGTATSVIYATTSDARLKTDHGRATDLAALRAVVVHDFTWTADGIRDRGVFAQETHDLYPRAVSKGDDETTEAGALAHPWMTDYSKFVPDLIVGWQAHEDALAAIRAALAILETGRR